VRPLPVDRGDTGDAFGFRHSEPPGTGERERGSAGAKLPSRNRAAHEKILPTMQIEMIRDHHPEPPL
jgi:hypothetical protein